MFEHATAVTRIDPAGEVDGLIRSTYRAEVQPDWDILGNANGGYLLAIVGRALLAATGRPDPISVTAHYLNPGRPGPVEIDVDIVRAGRRFTAARATMRNAENKPVITVLGTFGDLVGQADGAPSWTDGAPPDLAPLSDCPAVSSQPTAPPFMSRIDLRLDPRDSGWAYGQKSGVPEIRAWFRLLDDEPLTSAALLLVVDALPPTIFNLDLPVGWAPTVELTAHVRTRPVQGWLRLGYRTRYISSGFMEVDGTVWDESDTLVAQSRQLALLPRG